ncbi:MAG: iron-sulfur cluster assembly scaffold protein [Vicinamibacterales bacterium]
MTLAAAYSPEVLRRCREMPRAGGWPEHDPQVGTGAVGSLEAGTLVRLQVRLSDGGRVVDDARFKVFGCSAAIASASLAADRIAGASVTDARSLAADALAEALELPDDKRAMAARAVDAVRAAIEDWERKNPDQRLAARG